MAASVVLAAFLAVGLLDSLHYRPELPRKPGEAKAYASEVRSLLDAGLAQLRGNGGKTYSAPLATRSYAKEQVELPDGRQMRDFPRLRFGGAHLKDEGKWAEDVARKTLAGFGVAVLLVLALIPLVRLLQKMSPDIPWKAAGASLAVLMLIAGPAIALSAGY